MDEYKDYTQINAETWDRWAQNGIAWSKPITHEAYCKVLKGDWTVYLASSVPVPRDWLEPLEGKALLGLASGGGQQMPVFAALGARCTVFDYSREQLAREAEVAQREGYAIEIIRGDMAKPLPFADAQFDIVFHPVSNCYVEDVCHVWRECARVLKPGGFLLAGFDNGINFLVADDALPLQIVHKLPFNPLRNPEQMALLQAADDGVQFSHSLEEQIGGQLRAGFMLLDLYEDRERPGSGVLRDYAPQYIVTRAQKR